MSMQQQDQGKHNAHLMVEELIRSRLDISIHNSLSNASPETVESILNSGHKDYRPRKLLERVEEAVAVFVATHHPRHAHFIIATENHSPDMASRRQYDCARLCAAYDSVDSLDEGIQREFVALALGVIILAPNGYDMSCINVVRLDAISAMRTWLYETAWEPQKVNSRLFRAVIEAAKAHL